MDDHDPLSPGNESDGHPVPLTRTGVERIIDDSVADMTLLNLPVTPVTLREHAEMNVDNLVQLGRCLAPDSADVAAAFAPGQLEARCAALDVERFFEDVELPPPAFH